MEDHHAGAGTEKEDVGAAETSHYRLTTICIPHFIVSVEGEKVSKITYRGGVCSLLFIFTAPDC